MYISVCFLLTHPFGLVTGVNLESSNSRISVIREVNKSVCNIPGFISLQWLLQSHCNTSDIYYLLGCLLVNKEIKLPANNTQVKYMVDHHWFLYHVNAVRLCAKSQTSVELF